MIHPAIFILLFLFAFPFFWIAVIGFIARQGWREIAAAYPATSDAPPSARRVRFGSLSIGGKLMSPNYGSSIDGWFAQSGFWLRPFLPFRPFHPMIFIPWARVESVEQERKMLSKAVRVRLAGNMPDLLLLGSLGRAALERR
ncbi:hypothetical protein [Sphingomonas psychrotolerans]|uniref:Uncharacterized protein n=1 Tax=Sphingomonas psychrotolerans TaxID=1327635 RepID=A0A2K8MKF2_9SPHN|nr:hypothetical protein [Sphingomonas psychrotolerans]ATY32229.1 hypothetical protein CVN68_09770 [Sphingomonas psychrotolerans]